MLSLTRVERNRNSSCIVLVLITLLIFPIPKLAQTKSEKRVSAPAEKEKPGAGESELAEAQLPAFAVSLVISLATEARSYSNLALRPRVLARSADVLWDADNVTARALFKRAWEAAESGDADEVTIKTKDNPPAMAMALRRMSGRDLRFEVLRLTARRDRSLSEEFLAKLKLEKDPEELKNKTLANDGWSVSQAVSKRLQVASELLKDGQSERALETAAPVLDQVNVHTIGFLSALRARNPLAADRAFASLLNRAEFDPAADANVVSGLSSYVFTPGLYVSFKAEGGVRWQQPDEAAIPPVDFPVSLREKFFQVAASIILRPLPVAEQSSSSAGEMKLGVIKRLLPLFEQYVPETAVALRALGRELAGRAWNDTANTDSFMFTQGIKPEPGAAETLEQMQGRIDRAKTSRERDSIYASVASVLLAQGDERARDIADKIEEPERRTQIQQHVDLEFIQRAIKRKATSEAIRLTQIGKLSNSQRAVTYIDVAGLLQSTDHQRALELLEEAVREINRIESNKPDRALLLIGVASQLVTADRVRAWEVVGEAVNEANRCEDFTGDNTLRSALLTGGGVRFINITGDNFNLSKVFRSLANDDLYRAVDLAKSFKYDAPRATVTLAVASSILEKQKSRAG